MPDLLSGLVQNVTQVPVGAQLDIPAAAGDTVLTLDDAIYMNPTGGQVTIGGTVVDYVSSDDDEDSITLASPLTAPLVEGEDVWVYPPRVETTALVLVDGASDPVPATVPWNFQDALKPGVREEEDREKVLLQRDGEFSWSVYDLPGQELARDNAFAYMPAVFAAKGADDPLLDRTYTTVPGWFVLQSDRITINADRFTVGVTGTYDVRLGVSFSAATGHRAIRMHYWGVNGEDLGVSREINVTADGNSVVETAQYHVLNAGEGVSFEVWQNSGATLNIRGSNVFLAPPMTDCAIRWVGPR